MLFRSILMYGSISSLMFVGLIYGLRFLKLKNYLLGFEWIILGLSSMCGIIFLASGSVHIEQIWTFFDVFSRLFGITIIGSIGLLKVTHTIVPSHRFDAGIFALGFAASAAFIANPALEQQIGLPIAELVMAAIFLTIIFIVAWQCFKRRLYLSALAMLATLILFSYVSLMGDFHELGPDGIPIHLVNFSTAHLVWAFGFAAIYHSYAALARAKRI
jgi:hypothetical protein